MCKKRNLQQPKTGQILKNGYPILLRYMNEQFKFLHYFNAAAEHWHSPVDLVDHKF